MHSLHSKCLCFSLVRLCCCWKSYVFLHKNHNESVRGDFMSVYFLYVLSNLIFSRFLIFYIFYWPTYGKRHINNHNKRYIFWTPEDHADFRLLKSDLPINHRVENFAGNNSSHEFLIFVIIMNFFSLIVFWIDIF